MLYVKGNQRNIFGQCQKYRYEISADAKWNMHHYVKICPCEGRLFHVVAIQTYIVYTTEQLWYTSVLRHCMNVLWSIDWRLCVCRCVVHWCHYSKWRGTHGAVSCSACVTVTGVSTAFAYRKTWYVLPWCATNCCSAWTAWTWGIVIIAVTVVILKVICYYDSYWIWRHRGIGGITGGLWYCHMSIDWESCSAAETNTGFAAMGRYLWDAGAPCGVNGYAYMGKF